MARRKRQTPLNQEIRITFEPHRLSPAWVAEAYEQAVPIAGRSTPQVLGADPKDSEPGQHALTLDEPVGESFKAI